MHHNFRKLRIWQNAMEIVDDIYSCSAKFPKEEMFGLTSQIRRCAISLPNNIAEGAGRKSTKDFSHFLDVALSSGNELITELLIAERRMYLDNKSVEELITKVDTWQKMTVTFQKTLQ
jgi:four helix bundle protein